MLLSDSSESESSAPPDTPAPMVFEFRIFLRALDKCRRSFSRLVIILEPTLGSLSDVETEASISSSLPAASPLAAFLACSLSCSSFSLAASSSDSSDRALATCCAASLGVDMRQMQTSIL